MKGSMPSAEAMKQIVDDLEDMKRKGVQGGSSSAKDQYRYFDDKTLYSTD